MPIVPYRAVHTFNRNANVYQQIEIQWSKELLWRVFLFRWLFVPALLGLVFAAGPVIEPDYWWGWGLILPIGVVLMAIAGIGWRWLFVSDQRNRDIRLVIGQHSFGSSDPATWSEKILEATGSPKERFGTLSYSEAVRARLAVHDWPGAMLAARLCTAREDSHIGETLTDEVLDHPAVRQALEVVRVQSFKWSKVMQQPKGGESSARNRRDDVTQNYRGQE